MRRHLEKIVDTRSGELLPSLLAGGVFFCLLFGYFMLRPLRDAMGLEGGVDKLRLLFLATLAVMLVVNLIWAAVVSVLPRRLFVPLVYRFAIGCLAVFLGLLLWRGDEVGRAVGNVFYVWLSVFNLLAVSVFWQLMVDVFSLEQSKRLFGFIGVGGTAGAIVGSTYAWQLAEVIGPIGLMVSAAVLIEAAVQLCRLFVRSAKTVVTERATTDATQAVGGTAWSGLTRIMRSPYLLGIGAYVLSFATISTLFYFEKARIVEVTLQGLEERASVFALIELAGQTGTILLQLLLTGRLMKWLGVGPMLAVLPLAFLAGFTALLIYPTLLTAACLEAARRACNNGLSKPARDTLFTVVSRDDKYKAKSIIDTVFYRTGDVTGALADKGLAAMGAAVGALALPLAAVWIGLGFWLGHRERTLRRLEPATATSTISEELP